MRREPVQPFKTVPPPTKEIFRNRNLDFVRLFKAEKTKNHPSSADKPATPPPAVAPRHSRDRARLPAANPKSSIGGLTLLAIAGAGICLTLWLLTKGEITSLKTTIHSLEADVRRLTKFEPISDVEKELQWRRLELQNEEFEIQAPIAKEKSELEAALKIGREELKRARDEQGHRRELRKQAIAFLEKNAFESASKIKKYR